MTDSNAIRGWQFTALNKGIQTISNIVQATDDEGLATWRDSGTGWTVGEVLCHLRDFEVIFIQRARLTIDQHEPALPFPNPDQLAMERNYARVPAHEALAAWQEHRGNYLALLENQPDSAWERAGIHPTRGPLTLEKQLLLTVCHDINHIEQITRIVAERLAQRI